jgi:hypothetical protein
MNIGKHYKDFLTLANDPAQESLYKMGVIPSEAIAQVQNQKWATAGKPGTPGGHYSPPMTYAGMPSVDAAMDRGAHAVGRFTPFSAQSAMGSPMNTDSWKRIASGMVGLPIRGMSKTDKKAAAEAEKAKKAREQR